MKKQIIPMAGLMLGLFLQNAAADTTPTESSNPQQPTDINKEAEKSAKDAKEAEDEAKMAETNAANLRAIAKKRAEEAAVAANALAKQKAQEAVDAAADAKSKNASVKTVSDGAVEQSLEGKLSDWGFSAGLAALTMNGAKEVKSAAPDGNGILRAAYEPKQRIGFILEAHYFLGVNPLGSAKEHVDGNNDRVSSKRTRNINLLDQFGSVDRTDFAFGPSVCVEAGSNGFRSAGIGLMMSFRKYHLTKTNGVYDATIVGKPFNLGFYYIVEPRVQTLADGLIDGGPLPTGTAIRYQDKSRNGLAVVFSVSL